MGGLSAFSQLMAPASATGPGFLTTSAQTIAGAKTFTGSCVFGNITAGAGYITQFTRNSKGFGIYADTAAVQIGTTGNYPLNFTTNAGGNQITLAVSGAVGIPTSLAVGASGTAITQVKVYTQTLTPSSVAANTTAEQTFTVSGLTTADKVTVNGPAPTAGTGIVGVRVSAADTLAITFANNTAGALTPASGTHNIVATRS